jgi:hypothetical protein
MTKFPCSGFLEGRSVKFPSLAGRCEKIGLHLFPVIPAKAGIHYFQALNNFLDPGFHRGDE